MKRLHANINDLISIHSHRIFVYEIAVHAVQIVEH